MAISHKELIYQTLLAEYPHRHRNRLEFDNITAQINKLALRISGDIEYQTVVDFICKLVADETLPNTDRANLEFELFKYRYFWWAHGELKKLGIVDPRIHTKYGELYK